jgi:RNA polymerase sigma-70 factor (sigma-E family)
MADLPLDTHTLVEQLYRTRRVDLVRAAVLLLGDQAAAEEVVQDAFVALYRAAPRIREHDAIAGYLYRSVLNLARSQLRRRAVARRHVPKAPALVEPADGRALHAADRAVVLEAVAQLPLRQRECVVLRWYLDLSEREIAESLAISAGSVKTHLHRGRAALAERLEVLR